MCGMAKSHALEFLSMMIFQAERLLWMLCFGFVSRLPRVATSVYPAVSAYQGTTLVGPLRPGQELGFSLWVFPLSGKRRQGLKLILFT